MIVVFDAQCLLCSGFARFLLKHDRRGVLRFASMQGETGRALLRAAGVDPEDVDTVLFVRDGRAWRESAAALRILHALGWPWRLAWLGWLGCALADTRCALPLRGAQPLSLVRPLGHLHPAAARCGTAVSRLNGHAHAALQKASTSAATRSGWS